MGLEERVERKKYFLPHIIKLVKKEFTVKRVTNYTNGVEDHFYILGNLPNGRLLMYNSRSLSVIRGFDYFGHPIYDNCGSIRKGSKVLTGHNEFRREDDLVSYVEKTLQNYCKSKII